MSTIQVYDIVSFCLELNFWKSLYMYTKTTLLITSMRPTQWPKNIVVFTAFFFSINEGWNFTDSSDVFIKFIQVVIVFLFFCFLSGALYILNDIKDVDFDRNHPLKRFRPIADKQISKNLGIIFSSSIILIVVCISYVMNRDLAYCLLVYSIITLLYSFTLKKIVILDVFIIAVGFVIRVIAGAIILGVPISIWLYLCTGLGALILAFSKRRVELIFGGDQSLEYRSVFKYYSLRMIDYFIWVVSASLVLSYSIYSYSASNLPDNRFMLITIPLAIFGIFRFLFLLRNGKVKVQPEDIFFRDKILLLTIVIWVITSISILYLYRG